MSKVKITLLNNIHDNWQKYTI